MDFFDDEYYDGKNQSDSELEQEETPDISEFTKNDGRLRFRADFNLPDKYSGEKVSLSDFKKLRDKEVSNSNNSLKSRDHSYDYSINDLSGFDDHNEDCSNLKNNVQLSDSIVRKVDKYKEMEANFSIIDNTKIMDKMVSDKERGEHVKKQRKIWSDILAIRIFVQNVLKLCNQLPPTDFISLLDDNTRDKLDDIRKEILDLALMNHELQIQLNKNNKKLSNIIDNNSSNFGFFSRINSKTQNKRNRSESEFWDKYNSMLDNTFEWCLEVCDEWKKDTQIEVSYNNNINYLKKKKKRALLYFNTKSEIKKKHY